MHADAQHCPPVLRSGSGSLVRCELSYVTLVAGETGSLWCMRWARCTHYPSGGLHVGVVVDAVEDVVVTVLAFVIGHEVLGALNCLGGAARRWQRGSRAD